MSRTATESSSCSEVVSVSLLQVIDTTRNLVKAATRSDWLDLVIPWRYTSRNASVLTLSLEERREEKCFSDGRLLLAVVNIEMGCTDDSRGFLRNANIST